MNFKSILKSIGDSLRQGPMKDEESPDKVSSLTNGGFTGYHPRADEGSVKQGRKRPAKAEAYNGPLQQIPYQQPNAQTGFQPNGYNGQTSFQPSGYGVPQGTDYQGTGYNGQFQPPVPPQQQTGQQAQSNIAYIHTAFADSNGEGVRHIERLAQPLSTASCYRIIEFMRNGESVIVNVDGIPDDREKQRCLDLLYGAAFTMQFSFTRVATKSIYLIAPNTVRVMLYENLRQLNEQDAASRWPGSAPEAPAPARSSAGNRHGVYTPYAAGERYSR